MTLAGRINLQHGLPENKSYEHTNYSCESALDAFILARNDRRIIIDSVDYNNTLKAVSKDIEKIITDTFKGFT